MSCNSIELTFYWCECLAIVFKPLLKPCSATVHRELASCVDTQKDVHGAMGVLTCACAFCTRCLSVQKLYVQLEPQYYSIDGVDFSVPMWRLPWSNVCLHITSCHAEIPSRILSPMAAHLNEKHRNSKNAQRVCSLLESW